ncbi:hypothetical protein D9M68_793960 [compost metagenome]
MRPRRLNRGGRDSSRSRLAMISPIPKMPMEITTKSIPSASCGRPKVKRSSPELTSTPISPSNRPSRVIASALSRSPWASTTAATRPSSISEKYSAGPKRNANSESGVAAAATSRIARLPATNEPIAAMPSAAPALPWRAMA